MSDQTVTPSVNSASNAVPIAASGEAPSTSTSSSSSASQVTVFSKLFALFLIAALSISMLASVYLWRKISNIQEHLARQSADATNQSVEARALAKNAQDLAREASARVALNETRLSEVALQRTQLDELMQSLSRSRDENLVVDIESSLRLAQQQAQLTGSVEPLLAALKTADMRLARAAQPRLNGVRRALSKDTDRIKATMIADIPSLLTKLDELTRLAGDLPVVNSVAVPASLEKTSLPSNTTAKIKPQDGKASTDSWQVTGSEMWHTAWTAIRTEALKLVRVSRIESPDAVLLSPEQTFFLRENLKLKLLNARLALLSRQLPAAKADLASASADLRKYVDTSAKSSQAVFALLQQVQLQLENTNLPGLDESLSALTLAAAGR